jgi:pimeloyl-ACP methyl ester carboxylesterase
MLNYYRAAFRRARRESHAATVPVACPTLVLWGERDAYLRGETLVGLDRYVPDLRVERFPNATHWLPVDEPEAVSERLAAWALARD